MRPDFSHIDTWLFDLDHTLYPPDCPLMGLVDDRMTAYIARRTGLPDDEARALRAKYYHDHGTTMAGLIVHHDIDPHEYLADVQDVSVDCVMADPALRAGLLRLPGRRLVFTNAGMRYADRVLDKLGVADLFDDVFHIEAANFVPKPQAATFTAMIARHDVAPASAAFFEDSARNLKPAADLGMTTVLVAPNALESDASFVHHRTDNLPAFLSALRVKETS